MKKLMASMFFLVMITLSSGSEAAIVEWASSITNTNVINPLGILGDPDGDIAHFSGSPLKHGIISGFGIGENITYDNNELASFLGMSQSVLDQTDIIAIEYNGSGGGLFEGSNWIFDDGTNSISVSYTYEDDSPPSIIALGNIGNTDYASFFGFTNPWGTIGELAFILFDIDGTSAVNPFSPNLNVMLTAGSAFDPATPEPDVLGRFAPVPIPGAAWLLGSGIAGLVGTRIRRKKK